MEWSDEQTRQLRDLLEAAEPLPRIAAQLQVPFTDVAIHAAQQDIIPTVERDVKIPRGRGYDKQAAKGHIISLWHHPELTPAQYARKNNLHPDLLIAAIRQHYPRAWGDYIRDRGVPDQRQCLYCEHAFYPSNGNQQFCSDKHSRDYREDQAYFGGRRRHTIGMVTGVCQLCMRTVPKGLSAHHVLGKENDPDNEVLIALCQGCHDLVGTLARRRFADEPAAWDALISLVTLRRRGSLEPAPA